jgi:predicted NBD/HSP70 family sugar kinase
LATPQKEQDEPVDAIALAAVRVVARDVGVVVINCCRMYDPEVVLLGGGLSNSKVLVKEIQVR